MGDDKTTPWKTIKSGANGLRKSTKRLYQRVKSNIRGNQKEKETEVEEIHITQEQDDMWAVRPAEGYAHRQASEDDVTCVSRAVSAHSNASSRSKDDNIEVVHDMEISDDIIASGSFIS